METKSYNGLMNDYTTSISPLGDYATRRWHDPAAHYEIEKKKIFYSELADLLDFSEKEKTSVNKMLDSVDNETLSILKELFKVRFKQYLTGNGNI